MRVTEVLGLPLVDVRAARKVGTVRDIRIDPATSRIVALEVEIPGKADNEAVSTARVRRVGRDAVMMHHRPTSITARVAAEPEEWLDRAALNGLQILSDRGEILGDVVNAHFNQDTLQVEWYEPRSSGWQRYFGGTGQIASTSVASCSRELMIVRTERPTEEEVEPEPQPEVELTPASLQVREPAA